MKLAVVLFTLFGVITGFLIWRRIPRPLLLAILLMSATIYALSFFAGLWLVYWIQPRFVEGFAPYFLPIPLVVPYTAWTLRRHYKALDHERTQV
jgi:CHASE2 domain-containing sensor protein